MQYSTQLWALTLLFRFNLKSYRVNLVAPASSIECLLYLPNVQAIQYELGPERLTRVGNSNILRLRGKLVHQIRIFFTAWQCNDYIDFGRQCKHKTDEKAWHGIHLSHQWNILAIWNYYVNYQNYQNLMLLTSLDTERTLILFLLTNSAQRELVSICTQSIRNYN